MQDPRRVRSEWSLDGAADASASCVSLDSWYHNVQAKGVQLCDRKPQVLLHPELFFSDSMWQRVHDISNQRPSRIKAASDILISMDLTHPCPQTKQRVIAMLARGDPWIQLCATNAQTALDELTEQLRRDRPPPKSQHRPAALGGFPTNPSRGNRHHRWLCAEGIRRQ